MLVAYFLFHIVLPDKDGNRFVFESDTPLHAAAGRAKKGYDGARRAITYQSALSSLKEECTKLGIKGKIGYACIVLRFCSDVCWSRWHSFKKSFGMACWLLSKNDPVVCAKMLNHKVCLVVIVIHFSCRVPGYKFFAGIPSY